MNNRLRVLRAERGWSQATLAQRLHVSRQTINAIETGRYDPSLPLAFKIARLFDRPIEDIFDPGDDHPDSGPTATANLGSSTVDRPWEISGFLHRLWDARLPAPDATKAPVPPDATWVGIRLRLGAVLHDLPVADLVDRNLAVVAAVPRPGARGARRSLPGRATVAAVQDRRSRVSCGAFERIRHPRRRE